jgi:uncharacterized membrane protein
MRLLARALPSRSRNEQGVVAVVVAIITCFTLIPLAAFAVDIGVQRVARRDAQSVADVVALDMSHQIDGRSYTQLMGASPSMQTIADRSAARNSVAGNSFTVSLQFGTLNASGYDPQNPDADAYFHPITSGTPNAVKVIVTAKVGFTFINGNGGVTRSAIGNAERKACMTMGSYAAALNSNDSTVLGPLTKILGSSIDTQVLSSSGILSADIDILSFLNILKTQLGVGGIDDVLTANVTAAQVIAAQVAALNAQGATVAAQALQQQIGLHLPPGTTINVGTLLGITQGVSSGLGASMNALDLAAAAVQLANGTSAVHLTASSTNLTGLGLDVTVGSRPKRVCLGDGKQTMAQTTLLATADLNASGSLTGGLLNLVNGLSGLLSGVLGALGGLLGADTYDVPTVTLGKLSASVSLASASGQVLGVNCTGGMPTSLSVLEQSSLVPAEISIPIIIKETRHYGGVLGIGRKTETVTSTLTVKIRTTPSEDQSVTASLAIPGDVLKGKAGPSGDLSVGSLKAETFMTTDGSFSNGYPLLNKLLVSTDQVINSITNNLVTPLLTTVVTPLLNALTTVLKSTLGLTVAGSLYRPHGDAGCGSPKLVG